MALNYVDRPGLGKRLMDARLQLSFEWRDDVGGMVVSTPNDVAAQAIIDSWALADSIAHVKSEITAHAADLRNRVVAGISAGEMASWPIKLAEARSFGSDGDTSKCPLLSAEAAARGVAVTEIVGRVGGNATRFAGLEAQIGGTDGKHRDAITACTTFDQVAAYNWRTGWPEV